MYYYIMDHSKSNSNEIKKIEKIYKGGSLVNIPDFRKKSKSYKESDYPSISRIYRYFMNFDWESPSMDKFREKLRNIINKSLVLNFTSNSYFFYICSNYFPKENNYINLDEANEAISKILEEILSSKTIIKRRSYHIQKLKLLEDLNQIIEMQAIDSSIHEIEKKNCLSGNSQNSMISLEKLIDKISDKLNSISHLNKSKIESIEVRSSNKSDSPTLKQNTNSLSTCKTESEVTNFKICNDKIEYNRIGPFDDSREENLLKDMSMDSSAKDDFVKYLIFKHHRDNEIKSIKLLQSWKEELSSELNIDERACIICNDGDYDKDDLIVYCAKCHLTVHQSCYGIPILSEEDWLCNLCLAYPKEKVFNVQCLVCPVLGGAMKLCNINKSSRFYQEVQQIRNSKSKFPSNQDINSSDHLISSEQDVKSIQFSMGSTLLKKNLSEDQEELKDEEVTIDNIINNLERLNLDDSCNNTPSIAFKSSEKENIFEDCSLESQHFSNLNRNAKKEEIEKDSKSKKMNSPQLSHYNPIIGKPKIVKKLKNKNCLRAKLSKLSKFVYLVRQKDFVNKNAENLAWIHVTCALWNPQIRVKNFKNKEGISGIDLIPLSRFNELCSICSKQGFGPTVKCVYESCETSFHVECARMNKHQLETSNFASSEMKFKIYCKLHTPHYLLNAIEARRKKNKEEIIKFANLLKKCYTEFFDDNLFDYKLNNYNTNENLVLLKKKRKHNDDIDQYCKVVQGEKKEIILESNKDHMYVKLNKRQRRHLLHNIRQIYNKYNNMNIPVQIKTLKSFSRHCDGDFQSINNCQASEFGHAAKVSLHSYDSLFFNQMKNRNNSIGSCKFKRMSKQILDSIEFTPINCIDNSDRKTKNSRRSSVDYMIDQAQSKIPSKVNENKDNFQFTIINKVNKFNKKEMSYKDTLNPKIFPWYLIDNISRVTPKQAYLAYKHLICPDEITFMKKIQQKSDEEIQRKKNLLLRTVTYEVESENKIICYCKSPALSKGGLIVNCYNESYCVNGGWFHQQCIEELKNLRPWEISRSDFIFTCRECQQKLKEANDSLSIFIEINDDSYNDSKSDGRFSNNHSNKEPDNHRIPCGNRTDKNKNTINSILSPQMDFYLDLSIEEDESNSDTMNEQDEVDSTKQNNIIMIPLNDSDIDESGNLIIKDRNEIDYTNSSDDVYSHYAHYETESISCKSILKSYSRPLIAYSCSSGVCNMNKSLKEQNNDADLQEDNAINSPKSSKKPSALNLSICNSNFEYIGKDNSATKIYNESENENKNIITDFTVNEDSNANTIKPKERKIFEIINTKPQKVFQVEKTGSLCKSKLEINNEERSLKDEENKSSRGVNSSKIENKNFSDIIGNKSIKSAKSFFDFDNNSKKSDISAQEIKAQKQESFQSHFQPLPNKEKYFLVVKDNGRRLPTTKITKYFKEKKKVRKIFKCSNSNSKSNEKAIQIVDLNLQTN